MAPDERSLACSFAPRRAPTCRAFSNSTEETNFAPSSPTPDMVLETFSAIDRDPSHELVVAELAGEVVGTLQLTVLPYLHADGGCYIAQVEAVHVAATRRGGGIGEQMMGWAIDRAKERRCLRVQLTSQKARRDAHRFYARLGFTASHEGMKLYLT